MLSPTEILSAILDKPTDIDHVQSLVTPDVTYVSLNYNNPDLKRIMPWCGTSRGPESIVKTFVDVSRYWEVQSFEPEALRRRWLRGDVRPIQVQVCCALKGGHEPIRSFRKVQGRSLQLSSVHGRHVCDGSIVSQRRDLDLPKQPKRRASGDLKR